MIIVEYDNGEKTSYKNMKEAKEGILNALSNWIIAFYIYDTDNKFDYELTWNVKIEKFKNE